jgi:AraC-like DNA-binding protein
MRKSADDHDGCVFGTPWHGVHGTRIDSNRHYPRHWHTTYAFGVLERGAHRSASGRGEVDARAGDVITSNPGEVHDGRPIGGAKRLWRMLYLEPAAFAPLADDGAPSFDIELTQPVIEDRPLQQALWSLFTRLGHWSAAEGPRGSEMLACDEALARVGALLLRRHSTRTRVVDETTATRNDVSPALQRVRDRLADELLDPPSLAALAELAGIGRYQLLRRFQKAYGMPPHAWLIQQRAERARALVRAGVPLGGAAIDAGFADQSHMTRVFARQFGFTPGAWQRAARQTCSQ